MGINQTGPIVVVGTIKQRETAIARILLLDMLKLSLSLPCQRALNRKILSTDTLEMIIFFFLYDCAPYRILVSVLNLFGNIRSQL